MVSGATSSRRADSCQPSSPRNPEAASLPRPAANASRSSHSSAQASRASSLTSGQGSPNTRWARARRRRKDSPFFVRLATSSPPDLTASSATWRARTGSGRTGVDDNSIAPRRNTRLPRTFPPSQVTVVSLVSIASPDSKAADSESGTAARMRAPLVMREVRATASHGCPSSPGGQLRGRSTPVPQASRYDVEPTPRLRAIHPGRARETTVATASSSVMSVGGTSLMSRASRSASRRQAWRRSQHSGAIR